MYANKRTITIFPPHFPGINIQCAVFFFFKVQTKFELIINQCANNRIYCASVPPCPLLQIDSWDHETDGAA